MRRFITAAPLLALAALAVTSCSLGGGMDDEDRLAIDPPFEYRFAFDEEGVPHLLGRESELSQGTQRDFEEQVVGYGWEWVQTHEILADGSPKVEEYYRLYGVGPSHYYFESRDVAVQYFHRDADNMDVALRHPIAVDARLGRIIFNPQESEPFFTRRLDVYSIYCHDGTWHIVGVEFLGHTREDGVMRDVWGWSEYRRMTARRLDEIIMSYGL